MLGSILGAVGSVLGGIGANQASAKSAREQMDFQREMSNTAWQRGMADMKAAGLNPMLAFQQGPASAPSGASYQAQNPAQHLQDFTSQLQVDKRIGAETEHLKSSAKSLEAGAELSRANARKAIAEAGLVMSDKAKRQYEIALLRAQETVAKLTADGMSFKSAANKAMRQELEDNEGGKMLYGGAKIAADVFSSFFRLIQIGGVD